MTHPLKLLNFPKGKKRGRGGREVILLEQRRRLSKSIKCEENALQKVHTALPYKKQLKCYAGVPHRDAQAHWQEGKGMGNRGFLCRADRPTESWQYRITEQGKRRGIRENLVRNCVGAIVTREDPRPFLELPFPPGTPNGAFFSPFTSRENI